MKTFRHIHSTDPKDLLPEEPFIIMYITRRDIAEELNNELVAYCDVLGVEVPEDAHLLKPNDPRLTAAVCEEFIGSLGRLYEQLEMGEIGVQFFDEANVIARREILELIGFDLDAIHQRSNEIHGEDKV